MQLIIDLPISDLDRELLTTLLSQPGQDAAPTAPATRRTAKKAAPKPPEKSGGTETPAEAEKAPETAPDATDNEFEKVLEDAISRARVLSKTAEGKEAIKDALTEIGEVKVSNITDTETALAFIAALPD